MRIKHLLFPTLLAITAAAALAQSPFDGTWIMNQGKSHLAGDTMTFEAAGDGMLKYTDSVVSYTFKTDGSEFKTPTGSDRTFKMVDATTYEAASKRDGTPLGSSTWKLSDHDKRLTIDFKGIKANGETYEDTSVYDRTSGKSGLVGSWKSKDVKLGSPSSLVLASSGADDVTLSIPAEKATCNAKWDGKDYPVTGGTTPAGVTLAISKMGAKGFKLVQKLNGKATSIEEYKLSSDGKVLDTKGTDGEGKEPYSIVWDKQA